MRGISKLVNKKKAIKREQSQYLAYQEAERIYRHGARYGASCLLRYGAAHGGMLKIRLRKPPTEFN